MQTNINALSMEGIHNKESYSWTSIISYTWGSYYMGKIGACNKWHHIPCARAKGGENKIEYRGLYMMWKQ